MKPFLDCRAAIYALRRPINGRVLACCRYKRIKIECDPGYKLADGDQFMRCKRGRILGKVPKCVCKSYIYSLF